MHLGKFHDHTELQSWIVNFRTEVCSKAQNPPLALQWIKEIEAAKSLDDLITPKSIMGKDSLIVKNWIWWWRQHWKDAAISEHASERRSVSKSRKLKRTTDFSEGDKLLIWSTNTFDLLDPMMKLKDYRVVQYWIGERHHSGLWFTLGASIVIDKWSSIGQRFGRSVHLQVTRFLPSSDNYGTFQPRNSARRRKTRLSQTENVREIAYWTRSKKKTFRIQSEIIECVAVTKGKVQNSLTKRKTGECFQWKAHGSCSKGDSCSFLHTRASGNRETTAEEVVNARVSGLKPCVNNEQRASILFCTDGKRTDWREKLDMSRGQPCDWS